MSVSINGSGSTDYISLLKLTEAEKNKIDVQEDTRNVQSMSSLFSQEGMTSLFKNTQSVYADTTSALSAANNVKLSVAGETDANKAELLASAAPAVLTSQNNITQANNTSTESKSSRESTVTSTSSSSSQVTSKVAVEGGTDITATDATGRTFVKMMDTSLLNVETAVMKAELSSEKTSNVAAAAASQRAVDASARAGDKGIAAAKENFSGVVSAGAMKLTGSAATTAVQVKSLHSEGKSIKTNLKQSRQLELGVREHQSAIKSSKDGLVHQDHQLSGEVESTMSQSHAADLHTSELKRDAHNTVQLKTQKARTIAEYGNQGVQTASDATQSSFSVSASEKQKEAEQARADHDVNNELASTQTQKAKKAAETNAAIRNMTDSVLNTNSSAVSSIAEHIR